MNLRSSWTLFLAPALLATPLVAQDAAAPADERAGDPEVVVVQITDRGFRPTTVTVRHGAIVRFLQRSGASHNVEFVRVPEGARMAPDYVPILSANRAGASVMPPLRFGPYLMGVGETYDVRIDEYLAEGVYEYRCASHSYRGLLLVLDELGP